MKVRVKNSGTEIIISLDNSNIDIYEKSRSSFSVKQKLINFSYDGVVLFQESPDNFVEPEEKSAVGLLILLNNIIKS